MVGEGEMEREEREEMCQNLIVLYKIFMFRKKIFNMNSKIGHWTVLNSCTRTNPAVKIYLQKSELFRI